MNPHVLGQIYFEFEGLATNRAGVGFPTVTEADMGLQFTGRVVVFFAEATFTESLLDESHMPLQVSSLCKRFSRRGAGFETVFHH